MAVFHSNRKNLIGIKIRTSRLLLISLIALLSIFLLEFTETKSLHSESELMIEAAKRMQKAETLLRNYRKINGLEINSQNDPLQSGFIGIEFSPITTTLGDLKAKQSSTNPDFAALYIKWFNQLSLKKNDKIIIHASGSFPALTIAAIIASEVYGLSPIILSSIGASSFGANIPQLTYWDMENILLKKGVIHHKTIYATPGGQDDNASSFWENGFELMQQAADRNSLKIFIPKDLSVAIENKLDFINSKKPYSLFINIGGNQAALGNTPCSMQIEHGLITEKLNSNSPKNCYGLIHRINQTDTPIIHMLDIRDIALENGIDLLPNNSRIGEANIYYINNKSKTLSLIFLLILIITIGYIYKFRRIT